MKDAWAAFQIQSNKKGNTTETLKKLRPLVDEIYEEVLPEKYKRPTFSKYNDEINPWDHENFEEYVMLAEKPKLIFDPGGSF